MSILNPGDRVRLIDAPLPPPYKWRWMNGLRPGVEGVVTDGPMPLNTPNQGERSAAEFFPTAKGYIVRFAASSESIVDVLLEKLDGPPPEELDLPELEPYDALI